MTRIPDLVILQHHMLFGHICTRRIFLYKPGPLTCWFFLALFSLAMRKNIFPNTKKSLQDVARVNLIKNLKHTAKFFLFVK